MAGAPDHALRDRSRPSHAPVQVERGCGRDPCSHTGCSNSKAGISKNHFIPRYVRSHLTSAMISLAPQIRPRPMRYAVLATLSLATAAPAQRQWPHWGNDAGGMRYSELDQITPQDAVNCFRHCGYTLQVD